MDVGYFNFADQFNFGCAVMEFYREEVFNKSEGHSLSQKRRDSVILDLIITNWKQNALFASLRITARNISNAR